MQRIFLNLFDSSAGAANRLIARWVFLRALGLIYFSAFLALIFQVRGLIGTQGILPAADYLHGGLSLGLLRYWYVPTLLWLSSTDHMLTTLCWAGLFASILLVVNVWPRMALFVCFVCFLSFVSAAQDFSGYQSDGMLLEAGFLSLFLAPPGLLPGWGARHPPTRAAILLLLWEWFRIYFESGIVKLASGDPTWRNLTAMYEYYQNGPLPTWIGWYLQHLPNWFHIATAALTLAMELFLVWMALLPGRWRIACFFIVTAWQIGVIASANYAFLNYLVLVLAVLLLDDASLQRAVPQRWLSGLTSPVVERQSSSLAQLRTSIVAVILIWFFYATAVPLVRMLWPKVPLPETPVAALEPFRIANEYGLFAIMTPHRYEIEFRGLKRRRDLDCLPVPPQATGSAHRPGHLRTVPAALRLESLVCVSRSVGSKPIRHPHRGVAARRRSSGAQPLRRGSLPRQTAALHQNYLVAILVQHHAGKEDRRRMVAAPTRRPVRPNPYPASQRPHRHRAGAIRRTHNRNALHRSPGS